MCPGRMTGLQRDLCACNHSLGTSPPQSLWNFSAAAISPRGGKSPQEAQRMAPVHYHLLLLATVPTIWWNCELRLTFLPLHWTFRCPTCYPLLAQALATIIRLIELSTCPFAGRSSDLTGILVECWVTIRVSSREQKCGCLVRKCVLFLKELQWLKVTQSSGQSFRVADNI